jgi:hypothetical protein
MATETTDSELDVLTDVVRWQARAEAWAVSAMLDYRDHEMARTAGIESPMRRQVERSAICLAIGEATGLSEGQVQGRLSTASTVREKAPSVWDAFGDGLIDFGRVREIASTIDQLKREESVARLDRLVVAYAVEHTSAELRAWLRRFVQRVEADLPVERAEDERRNRHVSIRHGADSMGTLYAYLPSREPAAIEAQLRREARRNVTDDDDRTVAQREADPLVAWCADSDAADPAIDANIAVTIPADVLAGFTPASPSPPTAAGPSPPPPITSSRTSTPAAGRNHGPSAARQAPGRSPAATKSLERGAQRPVHPSDRCAEDTTR